MDAICLVCESAFEVEGELDLLVQIECPKCHRGILMLDAEDDSDITHYAETSGSGIFDSSPPEPLDVAASVLLGGQQAASEERWHGQSNSRDNQPSASRETNTLPTLPSETSPVDQRPHDDIQTVDSGSHLDAAALSLYNSEPEDLSRTLPEIPNPYAEPLPSPTPVPYKEMVGDDDSSEEILPKAPDTEVEMTPYGTGTAVDLPPVSMPSLDNEPGDDPLGELEGMLDSAITSLPSLDAVPAKDQHKDETPILTQEHPSFDQAFGTPSAADDADVSSEDEDLATIESPLPDLSLPDLDASAGGPIVIDSDNSHYATIENDAYQEPTESTGDESQASEQVEETSSQEDVAVNLNNIDNVDGVDTDEANDAEQTSEKDDAVPAPFSLANLPEDEAPQDDKEPPESEEAQPSSEVELHAQMLDDAPFDGDSQEGTAKTRSLLPLTTPEPYSKGEPHELEPLASANEAKAISPSAFSFDVDDEDDGTLRKTRPLRPIRSEDFQPATITDEDDDPAFLADVNQDTASDEPKKAEASDDDEATETKAVAAAEADEAPADEAGTDSAEPEEAKAAETQPSDEADEAPADEPAKDEAESNAPVGVFLEPVPEPAAISTSSGELKAPHSLTISAAENAPPKARSFSLAPPLDDGDKPSRPSLAAKQELNRTLAFGAKLPDEVADTKASAPEAKAEPPKEAKAPKAEATPAPAKKSAESLPMAGFGKLQEKEKAAPVSEPEPVAPATKKAAPKRKPDASADPSQDGMIDFDNLSEDFFATPAQDPHHQGGHEADFVDLIKQQREESQKILTRVLIAVPLLLLLVFGMFWAIKNFGGKRPSAKRKVVKAVKPGLQAPPRRTKTPAKVTKRAVGATAPVTDAGPASPDAGPTTADAGPAAPDATNVADAGPASPDVAPRPAPRRVDPPVIRRPKPRPRVRKRPRPRPRLRKRPKPRRRRRRPPRRRRTYNRAAAKRYFNKGQKQLFAGKVKGAIQQYKRANRADPRYAPAYRALGAAYMRLNNKRAAKRAWRTFLRLKPKDPMAKFIRKMLK